MRYAVLGGGKRIRPLLAFAAGELTGAQPDRVARAAAAVELIHAYSLAHDDLPCMDDDALRRGKPACHIAFDEATALLVGDALQSLAFQVLAEPGLTPDAAVQLAMVHDLAAAAGSSGMAGGQAIDLQSVGKALKLPELEAMHVRKTGALIGVAVLIGARCGAPMETASAERLGRYAGRVGLAFQVVDDILDATGETATLGKTAGKDARHAKPTYVTVLGLSEARTLAARLAEEALQLLSDFGSAAARLREVTEHVVLRER
jgi:farnesyl diphosphate synthase